MAEQKRNYLAEGEARYRRYRERLLADPEVAAVYPEEADKKALWLQLVEARQKVGLTQAEMARRLGVSQAQIARIEKRGYDTYTLNTLRRYVAVLGAALSWKCGYQRQANNLSHDVVSTKCVIIGPICVRVI